ncbi:MAG: PEP-CTERM sorting domain-containing protein [Desulfobacterales bacterium]|nr:PEP-CTERM sorting domain-containing protein [Desulfobacterales bacterium]
MTYSKLKILFYLTISLMLLFAPFLLDISPDGKAYAFSSRSHNKSSNTGDKDTFGYTPVNDEPTAPAPVPEPATWLLVGAGAAGVAVLRKKFKKK